MMAKVTGRPRVAVYLLIQLLLLGRGLDLLARDLGGRGLCGCMVVMMVVVLVASVRRKSGLRSIL
jgi:hypothetical protein